MVPLIGRVLLHAAVFLLPRVAMYTYRKVPLPPAFSVRVRDDNQWGRMGGGSYEILRTGGSRVG
jgi:hypothetical protein